MQILSVVNNVRMYEGQFQIPERKHEYLKPNFMSTIQNSGGSMLDYEPFKADQNVRRSVGRIPEYQDIMYGWIIR
jgi:hypothetical protein